MILVTLLPTSRSWPVRAIGVCQLMRRCSAAPVTRALLLAGLVPISAGCRNVAYEHTPSSRVRAGLDLTDQSLQPFRIGPAVLTILILQDTWGDHDITLYVNGTDSATVQRLGLERLVARTPAAAHELPVLDHQPQALELRPDTWVLHVAHLEGAIHDSIVGAEGDLTIEVTALFDGVPRVMHFTLARRVSWWVVPP